MTGAPAMLTVGEGLGAGAGAQTAVATAALTGIDLVPAQSGEELTLRADSLAAQPELRLDRAAGGIAWAVWLLLGLAALAAGVAISRRRAG